MGEGTQLAVHKVGTLTTMVLTNEMHQIVPTENTFFALDLKKNIQYVSWLRKKAVRPYLRTFHFVLKRAIIDMTFRQTILQGIERDFGLDELFVKDQVHTKNMESNILMAAGTEFHAQLAHFGPDATGNTVPLVPGVCNLTITLQRTVPNSWR